MKISELIEKEQNLEYKKCLELSYRFYSRYTSKDWPEFLKSSRSGYAYNGSTNQDTANCVILYMLLGGAK